MPKTSYSPHFLTALTVFSIYVSAANILAFSLPLLAFELSNDGLGLSLIKGAAFIPNVLFAIFVGVINDRIRKAFGYRLYSGLLAFAGLALLASLTSGFVSVGGLMVFMIFFNTVGYALTNVQLTLIRLTVPHDRLSHATSLSSGITSVINTVAPAVGGFALLTLGHNGLVAAVGALLVTAFVVSFWVRPDEELAPTTGFWASLIEGWQVFKENRELVMMTVAVVLTNAAAGAFDVGLVLKLKTQLSADDFQVGIVLTSAGVGAALASAIAARIRSSIGYRVAFFWPIWMLALLYLLTGLVTNFWLLCLISFCDGAISLFFAIGIWSYRQETVQSVHMGRVAGITGAIFKIGMPPVIILAGVLSDVQALGAVFGLAGCINLAAVAFLVIVAGWKGMFRVPNLRSSK